MKKFSLTKKDAKSLKNSINMFENPILQKGALEVTNMTRSGGKFAQCDWIKMEWAQIVE